MTRYRVEHEIENGWSRWVTPVMDGYKMSCCDCGLVHELQFQAMEVATADKNGRFTYDDLDVERFRVAFRARRNNRSTGQVRRNRRVAEAAAKAIYRPEKSKKAMVAAGRDLTSRPQDEGA